MQPGAASSLDALAAAADAAARAALHTLNLPGRQRHSRRAQKARPMFPHVTATKTTATGKPQVTVFALGFYQHRPGPEPVRKEERPAHAEPRTVEPRATPPRHAGPGHALTSPGNRLPCTHGT